MEAKTRKKRLPQSPERVERKRIEAGLQQGELAALAGIVPSHMSAIENGRWGASPALLHRLAAALGCKVTDLMPDEKVAA
jgi:transcriptional regulator with XRE-family HTH domain